MSLDKNLINKFINVTSDAAIACHKFIGKNDKNIADKAATDSMRDNLNALDINGKVVGVHDGIINFTIGQRRGIKVSDKEPLYVIEINAEKNEIIVGSKKYLAQKKIKLKNLNILCRTDELDKQILEKL